MRSGVCSIIITCSVAAALHFAFVRTGTFDVIACLKSEFNRYSRLVFWVMSWQIKLLNFLGVIKGPSFRWLAVMNP